MLKRLSTQYPRLLPLLIFVYEGLPEKFAKELSLTRLSSIQKIFNAKRATLAQLLSDVSASIRSIKSLCSDNEIKPTAKYPHRVALRNLILSFAYAQDELLEILRLAAVAANHPPILERLPGTAVLEKTLQSLSGDTPRAEWLTEPLAQKHTSCYGVPDERWFKNFGLTVQTPAAQLPPAAVQAASSAVQGPSADQLWAAQQFSDYHTPCLGNMFNLRKTTAHLRKSQEIAAALLSGDLTLRELVGKEAEYLQGVTPGGFLAAFQAVRGRVMAPASPTVTL